MISKLYVRIVRTKLQHPMLLGLLNISVPDSSFLLLPPFPSMVERTSANIGGFDLGQE